MNINWFTVIAQVINFLILVWLLKKFLYKPVLLAIDEREKKIVARLEDARQKKEEAKKEQDEFVEKNKQFEAQKKVMMAQAVTDTNLQKDKLLENAKKDVDALHTRQQKAIADMEENLKKDIVQKIQKSVFDISRKALKDLASADLEEQIVKLFISRLVELKDDAKKQFTDAFITTSNPVLIQSAFELQQQQQTAIEKAVNDVLGKKNKFEFKTAPEVISGIELSTNGYKLSWSISEYLASLQNNLSQTIKETNVPANEVKKLNEK
jgi:F-type H+-transporting ATPase subunit b